MTHPNSDAHTNSIGTDDARAGRTTGIMRYVLIVSTLLAIGAMTLAWVLGAFSV